MKTCIKLLPLFFSLFLFSELYSQNQLDKVGLNASALSTAAYSMRRLSSSYAGSALQVRRSSDNAVQDIGFTANGDLDTVSLKSFVGIGNGFVTAWYDQSGNTKNITQAVLINQPSLVISGSIVRENGRPFISFYGVPNISYNSLQLAADMTTVGHVSAVHRFAAGGYGFILGHTGSYYWHSSPSSFFLANGLTSASILAGSTWSNGVLTPPLLIPWPTTLTINELAPSIPGTGTTWNNIGRDRSFHQMSGGAGYSELIIFPVILSGGSRTSLEFSQASYYSILATLPITWLSFTAQLQAQNVLLKWQTASEQNSKQFEVQHSIDGNAFKSIGTVPAGGTSNNTINYRYLHPNPANGNNYYRLLQTDLDGKGSYSAVAILKYASVKPSFSVLVNPISNSVLRIQVGNPMDLSLYTADGKSLWRRSFPKGIHEINVNGYEKGMYLLKSNEVTQRFLLQ
ncbi:T9SS type A sorting domain-containing protein [Flavitalea sp.]|nr:arabinofuranosidase catalytic domain-containing protein [Flavitalea sp.]